MPFAFGPVFTVPIQTYFALRLLENLGCLLTRFTDRGGRDGAFIPGQLWLIFFLFFISTATLPIFKTRTADCGLWTYLRRRSCPVYPFHRTALLALAVYMAPLGFCVGLKTAVGPF